jgi:hypothetical protein
MIQVQIVFVDLFPLAQQTPEGRNFFPKPTFWKNNGRFVHWDCVLPVRFFGIEQKKMGNVIP